MSENEVKELEEQLLSCPFCGGRAYVNYVEPLIGGEIDFEGAYFIHCERCGCSMDNLPSKEAVLSNWNQRASKSTGKTSTNMHELAALVVNTNSYNKYGSAIIAIARIKNYSDSFYNDDVVKIQKRDNGSIHIFCRGFSYFDSYLEHYDTQNTEVLVKLFEQLIFDWASYRN
jgi:Lar family restriction alleviation protein